MYLFLWEEDFTDNKQNNPEKILVYKALVRKTKRYAKQKDRKGK